MASMREERLATRYARQYGSVHPKVLRHLLSWTLLMRESFDGDLDLMIVLAVIGDRRLKEPVIREIGFQEIVDGCQVPHTVPLTNRKSISDSTGIPRETVRRKVANLLARGWIAELPDGSLTTTVEAARALEPITYRSFEILSHLAETFIALEKSGDA